MSEKPINSGREARSRVASIFGVTGGGPTVLYDQATMILVAVAIFFSLTDLLTTSIAISMCFEEGNIVIMTISGWTGLGLIGALAATKILFLLGVALTSLIGLRTKDATLRFITLAVLLCLDILLFGVSLNNIYWIST